MQPQGGPPPSSKTPQIVALVSIGVLVTGYAIWNLVARTGAAMREGEAEGRRLAQQQPIAPGPADEPKATGPALASLRADVASVVPELRKHIAAGRTKVRAPPTCMGDFTTRLSRTRAIEKIIGDASAWASWPDPQFEIASGLSNTLTPLRSCINCAPGDERECDTAERALKVLESKLAVEK